MALSLQNPELEAHIEEKARSEGVSASEYLERLVVEDKERFQHLRSDVRAGFESIDIGDSVEFDAGQLEEFFSEIEAEGQKRIARN